VSLIILTVTGALSCIAHETVIFITTNTQFYRRQKKLEKIDQQLSSSSKSNPITDLDRPLRVPEV